MGPGSIPASAGIITLPELQHRRGFPEDIWREGERIAEFPPRLLQMKPSLYQVSRARRKFCFSGSFERPGSKGVRCRAVVRPDSRTFPDVLFSLLLSASGTKKVSSLFCIPRKFLKKSHDWCNEEARSFWAPGLQFPVYRAAT
jgi:hypothetical protein